MPSGINDESTLKVDYINDNVKLNKGVEYEEEVQQFIDNVLTEINNGNYSKAISLLDDAKKLYESERIEELSDLVLKLKSNSFKSDDSRRTTSSPTSFILQRKHSNSEKKKSSQEYKSQADFTTEQLNLVKKISSCENYYQVLSVSRESTNGEIKKAYKMLALQLHPDKNHAPGAVEAFKILGNAMTTLTDDRKRKEYDLSGANYITPKGSKSCYEQYYSHNNNHQHHHSNSSRTFFSDTEEFTAEELFHMFFDNNHQTQGNYRRRAYEFANQRHPQQQGQQPSLAFGLLLVMVLTSLLMSLFSTDPLYSLSYSRKYNVRHQTQHLSVPYYVKENFDNDYQGSLARLENSVEEDYVYTMKQHCFRERNYREAMMARARNFGSRAQFAQAQGLKMPSCDNLSKIGITRYSLY